MTDQADRDQAFMQRMHKAAELAGNATRLAELAGISRRAIGDYLAGGAEPSRTRLIGIARAAGVRLEWLATGQGPMTADQVSAPDGTPADDDDRPMQVAGAPPINEDLLSVCMEAVYKGLALKGYDVATWPLPKLASMIANLYNDLAATPEDQVKQEADDMRRRQSAGAAERRDQRRRA